MSYVPGVEVNIYAPFTSVPTEIAALTVGNTPSIVPTVFVWPSLNPFV